MHEKASTLVSRESASPFAWLWQARDSALTTFLIILLILGGIGYSATLLAQSPQASQVQVAAARVWPAEEPQLLSEMT